MRKKKVLNKYHYFGEGNLIEHYYNYITNILDKRRIISKRNYLRFHDLFGINLRIKIK